jgi:hypothetical protein
LDLKALFKTDIKILRDPDNITNRDAMIFSLGMTAILALAVVGTLTIIGGF